MRGWLDGWAEYGESTGASDCSIHEGTHAMMWRNRSGCGKTTKHWMIWYDNIMALLYRWFLLDNLFPTGFLSLFHSVNSCSWLSVAFFIASDAAHCISNALGVRQALSFQNGRRIFGLVSYCTFDLLFPWNFYPSWHCKANLSMVVLDNLYRKPSSCRQSINLLYF